MAGWGAGFSLRPPGPSIRGWGLCVVAKALGWWTVSGEVGYLVKRREGRHTCCGLEIARHGCLRTWFGWRNGCCGLGWCVRSELESIECNGILLKEFKDEEEKKALFISVNLWSVESC